MIQQILMNKNVMNLKILKIMIKINIYKFNNNNNNILIGNEQSMKEQMIKIFNYLLNHFIIKILVHSQFLKNLVLVIYIQTLILPLSKTYPDQKVLVRTLSLLQII